MSAYRWSAPRSRTTASCRPGTADRPEKCCAGTAVTHISLRAAASCHQSSSTTLRMPCLASRRRVLQAGINRRMMVLRQPPQRRNVQVIVVIVAQQNQIDRRQIFQAHSGRTMAPRSRPGNRAGPLRPDRVGENVDSIQLQQEGGVIDKGDAQTLRALGGGGTRPSSRSTAATDRAGAKAASAPGTITVAARNQITKPFTVKMRWERLHFARCCGAVSGRAIIQMPRPSGKLLISTSQPPGHCQPVTNPSQSHKYSSHMAVTANAPATRFA